MSKACVPNPLNAGLMKSWCRAGLGWRRKSGVSARVIAISRRWPLTRRPGTLSRTESREIEAVSLGIQPTKFSLVAAVCLLMIAPAGCVGIQANRARLRNAVEDRWERLDATRGLDVSPATAAVLGRQGLILRRNETRPARCGCWNRGCKLKQNPTALLPWPSCRTMWAWPARPEVRRPHWAGIATPPRLPRSPSPNRLARTVSWQSRSTTEPLRD